MKVRVDKGFYALENATDYKVKSVRSAPNES
jgi:hypothetical protein